MTRLALLMALILTPFAAAAAVRLTVTPAAVAPGGVVRVSAASSPCLAADQVTLISAAFPGHAFGGEGAVSGPVGKHGAFSIRTRIRSGLRPGAYHVGARCGGGNLNATGTIRVRKASPPRASARQPLRLSQLRALRELREGRRS